MITTRKLISNYAENLKICMEDSKLLSEDDPKLLASGMMKK